MDLIQKQRINYTVSITVMAAVFLLVVLGGLFGLVYATNDVFFSRHIDQALQSPAEYNKDAPQDMQCLFIFVKDGIITNSTDNTQYYGSDLNAIIESAMNKQHGKFKVGNKHFIVENTEYGGGILYAVFDRTSYHEQLTNTAIMVALLYCCSIVLVALLALLSSAKLLYPVTLAMKKQRDFVANTSHELKTPLTIISTNLSVIKSEPLSTVSDNEKWITSIEAQIGRMQNLINNMLELSKIEQSELPKQELNFSSLTEGACLTFEAVCFEKSVSLVSNIHPDIILFGDEQSLDRLVSILLDNAIKYCGENGKIGVFLTAEQNKAHLVVMNTGQTISKEEAEHVFDRFYRTDGARKNEDSHSFGLGLAIAQSTVKAHDGSISCHGVEDKGTVFDVFLPLPKKRKDGKIKLPTKKKKRSF